MSPLNLKLFIFDEGWRAVDIKNGHVEGIGPAKFAYTKRGKIVIADNRKILPAFQDLNDGKDGAVKNGSRLPFLRIKPSNKEHHGHTRSCNHSHCCPNANGSEHTVKAVPRVRSASIQTVKTVDASIQTSLTPSTNNQSKKMKPNTSHEVITSKKLQTNSPNKFNSPRSLQTNKNLALKHLEGNSKPALQTTKRRHSVAYLEQPSKKSRLSLTKPNSHKREKLEFIAKPPIIIDDTVAVPVARPLTDSKLDILVQDKHIDIIRSFLMENLNNFDLLKFDEGGAYQFDCICLLTPIIRIERSREIHRMLRERKDSQDTISQKDFVSNLGLTSISKKPAQKRYKMRNKTVKQTNDDKTKHTENNDKTKSKVMLSSHYTSEIDTKSDSETYFEPTKTKSPLKNKNHGEKQTKKLEGNERVLSSKTSGKVRDTYVNSRFETTRDSRKNTNKVYWSSSDDEVVLNSQKNKTTDKDIHDEREKQNKLTLKRNKKGWYLKSNTSADNDLGQGKHDITTKNNQIQNKNNNTEDMDTTLPKSVKNDGNKPIAKISVKRDKKGKFLPNKSNSNSKNEKNNTASNKNQIDESSFEISESNSNAVDDPPRQIRTRFGNSDSEDIPRRNKRPREKIIEFIDLSGAVSDEENTSSHKNRSEVYFSDESDVEVKKNKIASDIKSMSKKRQASSSSAYRQEYSSLEDHAIVSWVSNGGRARMVNGNRMWQELSDQYRNITGLNRSWHSLRNRYLRSILPRLEVMALDSVLISRLRAAASTGEIKSLNKQPPRRNSIFTLPTRGALSRRAARARSEDEPPAKRHKLEGVEPPQSRTLRSSLVNSPGNSSRSPRYSEITRRFARNHKLDTDSSTPTSRRNSTESENASNKSPEASTSKKDTKSNARNKSPEATTSGKSLTRKSLETKKPRDLATKRSLRISMDASLPIKTASNTSLRRSLRNRSVSSESPVATVKNGRQSFREKFEANKSESATKSRRKSLRMDDSISPVATTSKELPKSRRDEHSDGSISPVLTRSAQKSSGSATISRRKSVKDRSRSNSPVLTRSVQKSSESATKLRRKSVKDRSRSNSPVLTRSVQKPTESATKSRRKSVIDRSRSNSPVLARSIQKSSKSATKLRRKSVKDRSRSNSPVLTRSAEKSPGSATRGRRNSQPYRSPLATSSLKSSRRTRKLYNPKAGIQ